MALVPATDINRIKASLHRFASGFTRGQKAVTIASIVGVMLIGGIFMSLSGKPSYSILFSNLSPSDAGAITTKLATDHVQYQLQDGGATILVPQNAVDQERLSVAQAGLPSQASSSSGLSILDKEGITTSQLTQQADYLQAIQSELPEIRVAAPYLHTKVALASEASNWNTDLIGATPEYFKFWSVHAVAGAVFDAGSEDKVVVLGETIVTQLFPGNRKPIGEEIRIGGLPYTVVGVLEHRGLASTGQDLDDIAIIPMRTFVRKIARGPRFDGTVLIAPASRHDTARVEQAVRSLLRDRHRLAPGADDDFEIRVPFAK